MRRSLFWKPWTDSGLEHLQLLVETKGVQADGVVLLVSESVQFRLHYQVQCDPRWRVRKVLIRVMDGEQRDIALTADGEGHWHDAHGTPLEALRGCVDVDISATPFTNTLPIRRLGLQPGESITLDMVYVTVPDLRIQAVQQRYTCLEVHDGDGAYKYEGLGTQFTANLPVDADGLVVDYPGVFRRLWPR
jgi:hypothetical protein